MNINNISFPYPVLGNSDDVLPLPSYSVNITSDVKSYCFAISLHVENENILELINSGKAEYFCEIDCAGSFYNRCYHGKEKELHIVIDKMSVKGRISFFCGIITTQKIVNYINSGFHSDYSGYSFDMEPGELLGIFGQFTYDADIKYDKLQAINSFMEIKEGIKDETTYDLSHNKIEILLPSKMYKEYKEQIQHNTQYINIIHSSLAFNALVYALFNKEDSNNTLWARTLDYRLKYEKETFGDIDVEDPAMIPEIAQRILHNPYERMFDSLIYLHEQLMEEED